MLVTDGGKLIRTTVADIRIAGRSTRGVRLFRIGEDERVVSVAHLMDVGEAQRRRAARTGPTRADVEIPEVENPDTGAEEGDA